ncbi:unnamed protein product [Ectocarpus sp. CCAP 1310/34]|nr:unnamed protein product [Ectocarpus sp. CCAP 1310/34]
MVETTAPARIPLAVPSSILLTSAIAHPAPHHAHGLSSDCSRTHGEKRGAEGCQPRKWSCKGFERDSKNLSSPYALKPSNRHTRSASLVFAWPSTHS